MFKRIRIRAGQAAIRNARHLVGTAALLSCLLIASTQASAGDVVKEWNQIALAATVTAGQGAVPQTRSMAIVQVSVHDSINAITRRYQTYLATSRAPWGASPDAAAIAAAHYALVHLFPAQAPSLNPARAASLAAQRLTEADPGISVGETVAAAILSGRSTDGAAQAQFPYTAPGAGTPGVWVAVGSAPIVLPGWGKVTPWVLRSGSQFRPDDPPSLLSRRYARDYNEVKEIGSLTSATRTTEQTDIGRFWTATPSAIWNTVARQMIEAWDLDLSESARVLALLYLAASDAGIACWDAKYTYNFWRPITAIQNGHLDGNDRTIPDLDWAPLFTTHQHPEYPSGHTTNSSAMATILMLLFGDNPGVPIYATSPSAPGVQRQWATFSEGVQEVIEARIYIGFHFRNSDEVGARLGHKVGRFVMNHSLHARSGRDKD
jgi:PAP2 superfamily protein